MYNQGLSAFRQQSKMNSSKQFRQSYSQNISSQQSNQRSIEQFLHSQNDLKMQSFRQSLNMLSDLQTIQFEDNSRYHGQVVPDCIRQGIGIFETEEGDIYMGDWENDTYHGYGMYIYHDGERYEGQLVESLKQGEGKYFYKDGKVYEGMWNADQRQGEGIERDMVKGIYYQGEWANDQKQGRGKLCLLNPTDWGLRVSQKSIMEGIWTNNKFSSGLIQTEVYKGQFHNQTITGQGVYKFPDGSMYQGQFLNNLMHGLGSYYYPNGDVYEGEFYCGLKHGQGTYKYFTGDVYTGNYEKDIKCGEGRFAFVNGNYYVGEFERDCFNGKGKYFFTKDEAICGWWQNGQIVKDEKGQEIGMNRKMALMRRDLQNSNRTPRNDARSKSPISYPSSMPQIQNTRSVSPFNLQRTGNLFNKQEKAGIIPINPSRSPIKSSKFMEVHTPGDSYFKQSIQYSTSPLQSKLDSSMKLVSDSKSNKQVFENQKHQNNEERYRNSQLMEQQLQSQSRNSQYQNVHVLSKNLQYRNSNDQRQGINGKQITGKQLQQDRNLFEMMNEGQQEKERNQRINKYPQSEQKYTRSNQPQVVKKASKKFQR